jgi:hypothetical protein
VTGGGVSGSDMPSLPWTSRPDVSPAGDTSLESLLAGSGLPAGANPELRPVADVLAALSARPAGDELTGLAAARAEFRRHVVRPAHARRSHRRRRGGLAPRLGVKVAAATALVAMALGGAAAAAYAGVLPGSWQQFAHRTFGAPEYRAGHVTSARTGPARTGAGQTAGPHSRHPAHQTHPSGPRAGHRPVHHVGPPHHVQLPTPGPFAHHGALPGTHPGYHALIRPARDGVARRPLPERE